MENIDLPKLQTDLPLPEKEIPATTGVKFSILKSKFFIGFVAFSLLLAFLTGGLMLAKNNSSKEIACTLEAKICSDGTSVGRSGPKCEFSPCPTSTPDPTADWKKFTNSDFGYSFKHPSNLKIEELEDQYNLITANETKSIKISPDSGEYFLNIFVEKNPKNLSAVNLLMKYKSTIEKPTNPNDPSGKFVIDKINSSLSEYKNGEIEGLHALFGFDYDYDIVIVTKNNNIYVFDYYGDQGGKIEPNQEKIVSQILSTFKFTEAKPSCRPRPSCFDSTPRCLMPETSDMCPPSPTPTKKSGAVFCTQEAKKCPDGSYVGRTGPKCEFTACPTQ